MNINLNELAEAIENGELDDALASLESIVAKRQYAVRLRDAGDDLDRIVAEIDRVSALPSHERNQAGLQLHSKLRQAKKDFPDDPRVKAAAEALLDKVFGVQVS